jgi:cytochrome d ubiquinol oxidase subunit II
MSAANALAAVMWVGVTCYALFGGADFGAGFWDLVAGPAQRGDKQRRLIERSIGPVWEANHVWLIFVLVVMWTGFPSLFGAVSSTLYIPLTIAALGIITRGSAFAFRKTVVACWQRRILGTAFALSSIITPFFLGSAAGAIASGRVPSGVGAGSPVSSWWNPVSVMSGVMAVAACAYLAAVYLTAEARRTGDVVLVCQFRNRALGAGVVAGAVAFSGLVWLRQDASSLYHGLLHRGLSLVIVSAVAGAAALALIYRRRFVLSRIAAALAVAAVLWAWAVAQYPDLLPPNLTISGAAANHSVLMAMLICLAAGAVLLIPSLVWLYALDETDDGRLDRSQARYHVGRSSSLAADDSFALTPADRGHHDPAGGDHKPEADQPVDEHTVERFSTSHARHDQGAREGDFDDADPPWGETDAAGRDADPVGQEDAVPRHP